jgi:hypothetical protein
MMQLKYLAILIFAAVSHAAVEDRTLRSEAITVLERGEVPGVESGVLAVFVEVRIRFSSGKTTMAYIPYMETSQYTPKEGDVCLVRYFVGQLQADFVGGRRGGLHLDHATILTEIHCNSTPY